MDKKYFTPDIEDIRVGYECEWTSDASAFSINAQDDIIKDKLTAGDTARFVKWFGEAFAEIENHIRVPYLTKEQIEEEGWIHDVNHRYKREKSSHELYFNDEDGENYLWIEIPCYYSESGKWGTSSIYQGTCKDINTLRYISKLLNIQ